MPRALRSGWHGNGPKFAEPRLISTDDCAKIASRFEKGAFLRWFAGGLLHRSA
jgi:hypothetical protein